MNYRHQTRQPVVFKGLFLVLVVFMCLQIIPDAQAQSLNGQQIMQLAQSGNTAQAATALSSQAKIPTGSAAQLLQGLQSGGNIKTPDASKMLDGLIGGQIPTGDINNLVGMVQGLQNGKISPDTITKLIGQVSGGQLPPEIGKALSAVQSLGNLQNLGDLNQLFKNPAIAKGLQDMLSKAGLPQAVTKAISQVAQLGMDPKALQAMGTQLAAKAITDALKKVAPQLAAALDKLLGGTGALEKILGGLLGGSETKKTEEEKKEEEKGGQCGASCGESCGDCPEKINNNHRIIRAHVTSGFEQHRNWILTTFFSENVLPAMMLMSEHLTANGLQQVQIIGSFFDARHQLETQRLFQTLVAKAHKDYDPSESLCEIGTNVRSLTSSERRANLSHVAFANRMMARQTLQGEGVSGGSKSSSGDSVGYGGERDRKSRMDNFIKKFCVKTDHGEGLKLLCKDGAAKPEQKNMDVDYTGAFENKLTLDVDFSNEGSGPATSDEENIFALSANLFGHEILPSINGPLLIDPTNGKPSDLAKQYLGVRAVAAKRSVAQNSFAAIAALKAEGDDEVGPFLKAILAEAGVAPKDIEERLGEKPSYFAQMEVLTKDIYQNPNFYSNLYDKPVNIERKGAALQAIELMQDRDLYKSLLRSEAVLATLLETLMRKEHDRISEDLKNLSQYSTKTKGGS